VKEVLSHAIRVEGQSHNLWKRPIRSSLDEEDIENWIEKVDHAYGEFSQSMQLALWKQNLQHSKEIEHVHVDVKSLLEIEKDFKQDDDEQLSQEAAYGVRINICQIGTRTAILDQIRTWANDEKSPQQIFWLNDVAGSGKSTIAATMANEWILDRRIAGRFFFTPNSRAASGLTDFCTTVAKDLALHQKSMSATIQKAIKNTPKHSFTIGQQFQRLIIEPLEIYDQPLVLVFDALDNCDLTGHRTLLKQLIKYLPSISRVKAFVTSRPIPTIVDLLGSSPIVTGGDIQLYRAGRNSVNPDILHYINENEHLQKLSSEDKIRLALQSKGLFVWIATACRLLENSIEPDEVLRKLLQTDSDRNLDWLYLECLKRAEVDTRTHDAFMNILRILLFPEEPISIAMIEIFQPLCRSVKAFIRDLGSVVKDGSIHRPLWVLHPTFREFITQSSRANGFLVEPSPAHSLLSKACLQCLLDLLRYNMTNSQQRGVVLPHSNNEMLASNKEKVFHRILGLDKGRYDALRYATRFWARHVSQSYGDTDTLRLLSQFLTRKVLNWIEMLSLLSIIPEGIDSLYELCLSTHVLLSNDSVTEAVSYD
jgi:hypothetical protein